ncbi:MAG: hypothetical protein KBB88_03775 [Candidatus Pacebacteria bacterium]|nr:hypothetical protein [Candidatus Paceibacterota bacterium]
MFIVKREEHNPILRPNTAHPWEAHATFSWSVVHSDGTDHYYYRAMSEPEQIVGVNTSISVIAHATSADGVHMENREQILSPSEPFDTYGCEDPRVVFFENNYYLFYTALGGFPFSAENIRVAVAVGDSPTRFTEKHLITPFNAKAMTLFPERINGKIVALFSYNTDLPPAFIAFAECDAIEELWSVEYWDEWKKNKENNILDLHRFPSDQTEVGGQPIKTKDGWLLVYAHIQEYFSSKPILGVEAVLLDISQPRLLLGKTPGPFLVSEEVYERYGVVPNVIFPTGVDVQGDDLTVYYSAADTTGCRAHLSLSSLLHSLDPEKRMSSMKRYIGNPILQAREDYSWEKNGVFNPASIEIDGKIYIVYRAMSDTNTSTMGLAITTDGVTIQERLSVPIYTPRQDFEQKLSGPTGNSGCEDPRIVQIGETLYMTYTAYNGVQPPKVAMTTIAVKDFVAKKFTWSIPQIVSPDGVDDKDACLLGEAYGKRYYIFHRIGNHICVDYVNDPTFTTQKAIRCIQIVSPRPGMWDSEKVGIAGQPIKTEKGWIMLYHGVSKTSTYRVGAVLLDLKDPTIVLARTIGPIFEPHEPYEKEGVVSKVVFPCGEVVRGNTVYVYYGGADKVVGVATILVDELLAGLQ